MGRGLPPPSCRTCSAHNRDRGEPCGSAPPTPPYVRVRIRRFGGLSAGLGAHGGQTERPEKGFGEGTGESGAVTEPPGAMPGTGGLSRQGAPDPEPAQFRKPGAPALPVLPGYRPQATPDPLIQGPQHRRRFAEAEVAAPADQIGREPLDNLRKGAPARPPRQRPHPHLEAVDRQRRNAPPRRPSAREAEAQELAPARGRDRALLCVDRQLETACEEPSG